MDLSQHPVLKNMVCTCGHAASDHSVEGGFVGACKLCACGSVKVTFDNFEAATGFSPLAGKSVDQPPSADTIVAEIHAASEAFVRDHVSEPSQDDFKIFRAAFNDGARLMLRILQEQITIGQVAAHLHRLETLAAERESGDNANLIRHAFANTLNDEDYCRVIVDGMINSPASDPISCGRPRSEHSS